MRRFLKFSDPIRNSVADGDELESKLAEVSQVLSALALAAANKIDIHGLLNKENIKGEQTC